MQSDGQKEAEQPLKSPKNDLLAHPASRTGPIFRARRTIYAYDKHSGSLRGELCASPRVLWGYILTGSC
ncbi:hypothetical protein Poly41_07060 [Novipirellula artificiosorum]|uniref:Uncharacterized protein n=1 Tax=Novipirellula artificiosorum TaxID=2528016 RepID=A0A5C6E5I4_9BACT|nr:hypothetical protein Poly41_07060 [Novipirellula artificiosorum]